MKKYITILLLTITLGGCLPEGDSGCPDYFTLKFDLHDEYDESGDFDTRIANDVRLYIFRDGKLVSGVDIPYEIIRDKGEYTFRKTLDMDGGIDMVAWSVSRDKGDPLCVPAGAEGDLIGNMFVELDPHTRSSYYRPFDTELYHGVLSFPEAVDVPSSRTVTLQNAACRVEVNVSNGSDVLSTNNPRVEVRGTMHRMDGKGTGCGSEAVVRASLNKPGTGGDKYETGRFGVLPSAEGQTVSVDVYDDADLIARLSVPREALPRGARSGDLLIFDYTSGSAEFWLTVNGYRQKFFTDEL